MKLRGVDIPPLYLIVGGTLLVAGVWVYSKGAGGTGQAVGGALVNGVVGLFKGVASGVNAAVLQPLVQVAGDATDAVLTGAKNDLVGMAEMASDPMGGW